MRILHADDGAGIIEYSLVVVLIALVAITGISFVGQTTSDTFDQAGQAFPTDPPHRIGRQHRGG
jgi:Flp pilus assembly pilin Flp